MKHRDSVMMDPRALVMNTSSGFMGSQPDLQHHASHGHDSHHGPDEYSCRGKLTKYLHSHPVLILISILSVLDAACVIGELMIDLIMINEKLDDTSVHLERLVGGLSSRFPDYVPKDVKTLGGLSIKIGQMPDNITTLLPSNDSAVAILNTQQELADVILETLSKNLNCNVNLNLPKASLPATGTTIPAAGTQTGNSAPMVTSRSGAWVPPTPAPATPAPATPAPPRFAPLKSEPKATDKKPTQIDQEKKFYEEEGKAYKKKGKYDKAKAKDLKYKIAHSLHLGSVTILTSMFFVCVLRIFAEGKSFFRNRLEVIDAFVVTTSMIIDMVLLEGIWKANVNAALLLVIILPWRVIRIINSFLLTAHEKDHIHLAMAKASKKKTLKKAELLAVYNQRYKNEIRALRKLARKHGAHEADVQNCRNPSGMGFKRRVSWHESINGDISMYPGLRNGILNKPHMRRMHSGISQDTIMSSGTETDTFEDSLEYDNMEDDVPPALQYMEHQEAQAPLRSSRANSMQQQQQHEKISLGQRNSNLMGSQTDLMSAGDRGSGYVTRININ